MREVDLLIEAGWVIPVEPHGVAMPNHAVVIHDGRIVDLLPIDVALVGYLPNCRVQRPDCVLLPGFVNAHAHNPMSLMRGLADDLPLMTWLQGHIWPVEAAVLGPDFVRDGTELAIVEMLRGGTTCANENYFFPDVSAHTYHRLGFRACVGLPIIDFPTPWARSDDEYFERALAVHDEWRGHPQISTAFAPHAPYTVKDASFERIALLSQQLNLQVHCHVHETAQEVADSLSQYRQRPLARLHRLELLNEQLIAVHMTQLTPAEIELCAAQGVSVVHCPESNLKLASGFCPVSALHRAGVGLALGTDGCASNNDLDMLGEMRTAALLAKGVALDAAALDAPSALRMATLGGARAMALDEHIGSIEVGKQADLITLRVDVPEMQPLYDPISQIVYAGARQYVRDVWIAGECKVSDGELVDIDAAAVLAKARHWGQRIANLPRRQID
jgi:5-methylthioadenosine/S-adenosylhomocysteine deaminase